MIPPRRGGGTLAAWGLAGALGLVVLGALHVWVPSADPRYTVCLFRRFTGIPCPACGFTRAFAHLAKGEWRAAVIDHPLAPLLAAEAALAWVAWGAVAAGVLRPARLAVRPEALAIGHGALLVAVWLGRLVTGSLPW